MKTLLSIAICILGVQAWWTEFELSGVENSNGGPFKSDFKVSRFNKTTYTISGDFEFTENVDDRYECELKSYFSRQGNNQYTLLPYKVTRTDCCKFFDGMFFRFIEKELAAYSNVPKREQGVPLCKTYTKGLYTLKPDAVDKNIIVKYMDVGSYKLEMTAYNKASGNISSIISVYAKLY